MLPAFKECVEQLFVRGLCKVGLRDRDPGPRHQHAGPHGRDREAEQVERRDPRRHHAGGVHPAHRSRRPPRPRRRGARGRAVAAGHEPAGAGRPRVDPHLPAPLVVPAVVQHGGQPRAPVRPDDRRASCSSSRSRSSRPTRPWSGWPGSCARARTRSTATARRRPATSATSWSTPRSGSRISDVEKACRQARRADRREEALDSLSRLKPGDVIEVPAGKFAGFAVVVDPGLSRRRAAALRRDRRAAGPAAGDDRLPDPGGRR